MAAASQPWLGVLGAVFLLVPGLLLFRSAVRRFRTAATVRAAKSTPVGELSAGGLGSLEGKVVPLTDERVPAHLLDEEGVAVATQIKHLSGDSGEYGGGEHWHVRRSHFDRVPFAVDDGTGRVEVRPPDPDENGFWEAVRLKARTLADDDEAVARRAECFDDYAFDGETSIGETDTVRRYTQGILEAGDDVTVMGDVRRTDGGDLVVAGDPDSFALSNADGGDPSVRRHVLAGLGRAVLGLRLVALGGALVALAVPTLP